MKRSLLVLLTLTLAACDASPSEPAAAPDRLDTPGAELTDAIGEKGQLLLNRAPDPMASSHDPITYEGVLELGHFQSGSVGFRGRANGDWIQGDFWSFCARAGEIIDIEVHRTTSAMDPVAWITSGTSSTVTELLAAPIIASADDNNGVPHGVGGSWADPRLVVTAPYTGVYTLEIHDFFGLGPPDANGEVPYDIQSNSLGGTGGGTILVSASTGTISPPDWQMHPVTITPSSCSGSLDGLTLHVDVTSNGSDGRRGIGPDWTVTDNGDGTFTVELRARWNQWGAERIYTITVTAIDNATGETVGSSSTDVSVSTYSREAFDPRSEFNNN